MKTERRHELEKNSLADGLGVALIWCEENARLLLGVVAGVAIIGIAFLVLSSRKAERENSAWNEYFSARSGKNTAELERLAKADDDILAGQLADLTLADIALNQGLDLMSSDREQAETKLVEARNFYAELRKKPADPRLLERAALGMARFHESMGSIPEAITEYTKLKDWKGGLYTELAGQKIAYLSKPATTEFAAWYKNQKPKPRPSGTALFDPNNLNSLPPFSAATGAAATSAASTGASSTTPLTPAAVGTAPTPSATPSATPAASAAPTPSASPSATPVASPSATPVTKPTASPSVSPSATPAK